MSSEHRSTPRIDKLSFISFIEKENGEQKCPVSIGRTLNISATGLGIEVFQQIPAGSTMEMDICLGNEIIAARGKVIRSSALENGGHFLGIEFDTVQQKLATVVFHKIKLAIQK